MTAAENPPDWPLVAEQAVEEPVLTEVVVPADDAVITGDAAVAGDAEGGAPAGEAGLVGDAGLAEEREVEPGGSWLRGEDLRSVESRWREIQVSFVDEPRKAVTDANTLVADLMRRLAQLLFDERAALEQRCLGPEDASTEELRQGLRSYRAVFQRLLAGSW